MYERQVQGPPAPAQVTVHEGAGFASALALVNNTAAVIGGTDTDQVSWFTARTPFPATTLTTPRAFPAAAAGAEGVLVVGGGPGAEWITITGAPVFIDGVPDSVGGWVTASPSGQTFLAIGGSGAVTTIFRGCPACVAEPGPEWTRARDGASAVRTEAGVLWIVGGDDSALVDLVRWEGEMPMVSPGPDLSQPRAGAAVAEHASGVVFVVGGENAEGMLAEAELCTPAEGLDPLN